jgi:cyanophycinase-like exopeptidase
LLATLLLPAMLCAQGYTNWITGNPNSITTDALGGVCLMGGATENDEAMRWFLQRANGGDVLVLRASGSNGYNNYLHTELGIPINRVETIRFDNASAAFSPYVHQRIQEAEAIWFAGGNQWNYVSYWRGTPIDSLINVAISERNIVIGGTSAGMVILGGSYFTAEVSSVTSAQALMNPYHPGVTVSQEPFLNVPYMADVVTDTHYDNPDRRGRHTVFLSRMFAEGINARGIACNEYTAVCVDPNGMARVYGEWPQYPEYAFFLQINCLEPDGPEVMQPGVPLTWHRDGQAVKVYKVPGTMQGSNTFDLTDWVTGTGGTWEDWSVQQGLFSTAPGDLATDCLSTSVDALGPERPLLGFDRHSGEYVLSGSSAIQGAWLRDVLGRELPVAMAFTADGLRFAPATGLQLLTVHNIAGSFTWKLMAP